MDYRIFGTRDQLLESTYNEALLRNEIHETRWKNFKEEHEALSSRLLSLREKLKHDTMVPIGKLALMKGKLIHTNEILVSLGDGWFVKKSAAEAADFCNRKTKECDEMLDKLKKERELLSSRKTFPTQHDLFSNDEIIETYDEAAEADWRERHRESVRAHKQAEAKKRSENKIRDEEDIFELLDALELQEEEEDELNRLDLNGNNHKHICEDEREIEDEADSDDDEDDSSEDEESDDKNDDDVYERERENENSKFTTNDSVNNVKMSCLKEENVSSAKSISEDDNLLNSSSSIKKRNLKESRKVSFAKEEIVNDNSEDFNPVIIHFKHSDVLPKLDFNEDSVIEDVTKITSPSDIYRSITESSGVPKSILKKSVSFLHDEEMRNGDKRLDEHEKRDLDDIRRKRSVASEQVKIGDIVERSEVPSSTQISSERRVSKFKASRQSVKK